MVRFFDHDTIERSLSMSDCIEAVEAALRGLNSGDYSMPLRRAYAPPDAVGAMTWMPAFHSGADAAFGVKLLVVVPTNGDRGLDTHQGAVLLMDGVTGELRAVLDASAVTAIRTAAASAVATRALAREDSEVLAIVGTGIQARKHLEAIPLVRPIRRVIVAGRTSARAREFVESLQTELSVEPAATVEAALREADIVVTCTSTREPVVRREYLHSGQHINAAGASVPPSHELHPDVLPAVALFTDQRLSLEAEAYEWQLALAEGLVTSEHLRGELGQVLNGVVPGRLDAGEITVFRSLGIGVEDLAAAQHVLNASREEDALTE
jgi:ornithine cyclodeaminase/alanine dehydrogenase-like protein (mu-crystallin family)